MVSSPTIADRFAAAIKRNVTATERLGIAVSGGVDSACLLHLFVNFFPDLSRISVINVEHGIRGENSRRDTEFVRALANIYNLPCHFRAVSVPERCKASGRSEESEARLARREYFAELVAKREVDVIVTAHHQNDCTESVLMHLFRGCGIKGLVGMGERDGEYLRPLLGCTRAEIEQYAAANHIEFVTDETNAIETYNRNYLRAEVIPSIKKRYPGLDAALAALSENARQDEQFIASCLDFDKYISSEAAAVKLSLAALDLPPSLAHRYIFRCAALLGRTTDLERTHILAVMRLKSAENGKRVSLGGDLTAAREYDKIAFYNLAAPSTAVESDSAEFALGLTPFGDGYIEVTSVPPVPGKGALIADADKIPDGAVIRYRREGDVFRPFGSGQKKLKEYLIDKKIPLRTRDKLPLLCYNNTVLAVFGVEISDDIRLTAASVNAFRLCYTDI